MDRPDNVYRITMFVNHHWTDCELMGLRMQQSSGEMDLIIPIQSSKFTSEKGIESKSTKCFTSLLSILPIPPHFKPPNQSVGCLSFSHFTMIIIIIMTMDDDEDGLLRRYLMEILFVKRDWENGVQSCHSKANLQFFIFLKLVRRILAGRSFKKGRYDKETSRYTLHKHLKQNRMALI